MLYLCITIKSRFKNGSVKQHYTDTDFLWRENRSRGKDISNDHKIHTSINMLWSKTKQKCDMVRFKESSNTRWSPLLRVAGGAVLFNHSLVTGGRSTYNGRTTDLYHIHIPQNGGTSLSCKYIVRGKVVELRTNYAESSNHPREDAHVY